ncbi:centrosome and spindle pole-associated protein 1-like isoform X2 [Dunckerocampus dactyliophorus]|uniref:centrosome and spindle pole-associated protein 1-like isoform X2 n=1 Tax=Dunckerocampus dactyliophorus TaxID=161453 RepID=UPI0024063B7B|nr:centrosome and spindle pole-associated protein 1-like isoform X2 [Dunckerocampus dactyliophorus]
MMEMEDELENFIKEHKAKVAQDRASLEQDPPYMEIKEKPHRSHESTLKENIPPKWTAQKKEEITFVGLPLGVEYEKKKKKLQHELRMDYRRYMAQQNLLEKKSHLLKQRSPSRKDAATLTEARRDSHSAPTLPEGKTPFCPEEPSMEPPREKKEMHSGFARHGRRSTALNKSDDADFATGLLIGAIESDEALHRRKERYRQELQEQIAEQHRNKMREKNMELEVAVTRANDPEKQCNQIRQIGPNKGKKEHHLLEPSALGDSESSSKSLPNNGKTGAEGRRTPPPHQPHLAFQSPVMECSSTMDLMEGGLYANSHPAPLPSRAMDTPRFPMIPPHPPLTITDPYRGQYAAPHHYYSSRNPLDPNIGYYGQLPYPAVALPMSYYAIPPGGVVPSQFGDTPQCPHSGRSSFPGPPLQTNTEPVTPAPHSGLFPPERPRSSKEMNLKYRDALKKQDDAREGSGQLFIKIQEQQERKRMEREERERLEAQLEADMKNHQPWGRGGGGAPLRDHTGNLIADLKQMHKLNEEAYSNPEGQRRAMTVMTPRPAEHPDPKDRVSGTVAECSSPDTNDRLPGFTHVQTPQFARGTVFPNLTTLQQLHEQDKYKADLKLQIEEKQRKRAADRERIRLEEEKLERKVLEQNASIQREYKEEQEKKKQKEMEQKAKVEELLQLAEQKRKEAERKKAEEKEKAAQKRQYERERQALMKVVHREPSPPVPTPQRKQEYSPRPPTLESRHSTARLSEQSFSSPQSPPVPACRNQLRAAGEQRDVYSELSALRRQLRSEQKRLECHLQQEGWDGMDSPLAGRQARPHVDVFDMARQRRQAPVRRPNSRNLEPSNLLRIHDSLQIDYSDGESRLNSNDVQRMGRVDAASRRRRNYMDAHQQRSNQRSTHQDDFLNRISPLHQNDYLGSVTVQRARGPLLESESAFLAPLGEAFPVPSSPDVERTHQLSARERRRRIRQCPHPQEQVSCHDYPAHISSGNQREVESSSEEKSQDRTYNLMAPSRRGNTAGTVDLSDDESLPPHLTHHRQSSVESFSTDPWMRPGTSETLKCLEGPLRRERLTTHETIR